MPTLIIYFRPHRRLIADIIVGKKLLTQFRRLSSEDRVQKIHAVQWFNKCISGLTFQYLIPQFSMIR